MDGTETIIRKYFLLLRPQKRRPKEVNNCYRRHIPKITQKNAFFVIGRNQTFLYNDLP